MVIYQDNDTSKESSTNICQNVDPFKLILRPQESTSLSQHANVTLREEGTIFILSRPPFLQNQRTPKLRSMMLETASFSRRVAGTLPSRV